MFYPHARPLVRAIHSLEHLAELSDAPSLPLCLSERSLYVLQNLATLDAVDSRRYARLINPYGYVPVQEGDDEYALFQSTIDNLCLELIGGECAMPPQSHIFAQQPSAQGLEKNSYTTLIFPSVIYDALEEYDPRTGVCSAREGNSYYKGSVSVWLGNATWPVGKSAHLYVVQNVGGAYRMLSRFQSMTEASLFLSLSASFSVRLASPGDYFFVALYHDLATDAALFPGANFNNLWIDRLA